MIKYFNNENRRDFFIFCLSNLVIFPNRLYFFYSFLVNAVSWFRNDKLFFTRWFRLRWVRLRSPSLDLALLRA
jgi:hypothetical protein